MISKKPRTIKQSPTTGVCTRKELALIVKLGKCENELALLDQQYATQVMRYQALLQAYQITTKELEDLKERMVSAYASIK